MRFFISLLFLIFITATAESQVIGEKRTLSLKECLDIAMKRNYDIQLNNPRLQSADARLRQAFGSYLPTINFNAGYSRQLDIQSRTINVGGQVIPIGETRPNSYNMSAIASFTIFDGFGREAVYDAAQENYTATELSNDHRIKTVILNVYRNYINVINNYQIVRVRQENLDAENKQLERIRAQYEAGITPKTDVYAQEAEIGTRELELVQAKNALNNAKAQLLTTIGLQPDIKTEFMEESLPSMIDKSERETFRDRVGTEGIGIQTALQNRKDFLATQHGVDLASANVTSSKSQYFPTISASGGWNWSNFEFTDFNQQGRTYIGLNLNIPIFQNFRVDYQVENAQLQQRQREIELLQLEQSIRSEVQTAYMNLESAEKQIEIAEKTMISAEQNYFSIKEKYNVGAAGVTELVLASNRLVQSQINRINAVYNYIEMQKMLLYAIGEL